MCFYEIFWTATLQDLATLLYHKCLETCTFVFFRMEYIISTQNTELTKSEPLLKFLWFYTKIIYRLILSIIRAILLWNKCNLKWHLDDFHEIIYDLSLITKNQLLKFLSLSFLYLSIGQHLRDSPSRTLEGNINCKSDCYIKALSLCIWVIFGCFLKTG